MNVAPPFLSDEWFRYLMEHYSILLTLLQAVVYPALTALGLKAAAVLNRAVPSNKIRDLLAYGKQAKDSSQ